MKKFPTIGGLFLIVQKFCILYEKIRSFSLTEAKNVDIMNSGTFVPTDF